MYCRTSQSLPSQSLHSGEGFRKWIKIEFQVVINAITKSPFPNFCFLSRYSAKNCMHICNSKQILFLAETSCYTFYLCFLLLPDPWIHCWLLSFCLYFQFYNLWFLGIFFLQMTEASRRSRISLLERLKVETLRGGEVVEGGLGAMSWR